MADAPSSARRDTPRDDEDVRAGRKLYVEIRTPEGESYAGHATSVRLPASQGSMGVLPKHAPLMSSLEVGLSRVRDPVGTEWRFVTGSGFVEVFENRVLVLVDSAEDVAEIDLGRAEAARERARRRLREGGPNVDRVRAEAALDRAATRMRHARR